MDNGLLSRIQTPCKLSHHVISPSFETGEFDSHGVDCPFPFYHQDRYWMLFIGWDGRGYQTGIAHSEDLLHWEKVGLLIGCGKPGSVTEHNVAMTSLLRDNALFGLGTLKQVNGRYVGTYHAYPKPGYEAGPAVVGLCYSDDLRNWEIGEPVLHPDPECSWESGGLYKSWILESEGIYYLFYNAKNVTQGYWTEQTGFAVSKDLVNWERHPHNPVLTVGEAGSFDDHFASDPCVLKVQDSWLMFYFGLSNDGHAREGVAFSQDLHHWEKSGKILIDVDREDSIDSRHAHKPGMIYKDGVLYHFFCAVSPGGNKTTGNVNVDEIRGIALATSSIVEVE
jgi:predicted GH43/DUF377 family glycosyl hydrolase